MKKILISVLALMAVLVPSISFASINNNLSYGSRGAQVTELQEFLIDKGFLQTQSTGNFYSLTLKAVKAFQSANGISNTGYVGILTRTEINSQLVADTSGSTAQQLTETGTTTVKVAPASVLCPNGMTLVSNCSATYTVPVALCPNGNTLASNCAATSTNSVLSALQQQNQLLQQQIAEQQKTNQNLQNVVQNTTPAPVVTPPPVIVTLGSGQCIVDANYFGTTTPQEFFPFNVSSTFRFFHNTGKIIHQDGSELGYSFEGDNPSQKYLGLTADVGDTIQYDFSVYSNVSYVYGGFSPSGKLGEISGTIAVTPCATSSQ